MTPAVDAIGVLPSFLPTAAEASGSTGFAQWMAREMAATNRSVVEADRGVQRLATGDTSNLHQVMLGIEQARLQFQLLVQVRNRMLEAYQDILRMQV